MNIDCDKLLRCAVRTARAAAGHAFSNTARRLDAARTAPHDVKLKLDLECQALARKTIRSCFPKHRVIGEEDAASATMSMPDFTFASRPPRGDADDRDFTWIVDPIDGTVNFSHGLPLWCCSVAVAVRNEIVAGAVYAPALKECYAAGVHGPATCNGAPIRVSGIGRLADAMVATGMDRVPGMRTKPYAFANALAARTQRARILGSATLDLCFVAKGIADGYFEAGIYIWDIAAAGIIVRQAGGQIDVVGRFPGNRLAFLASNGRIHRAMKSVIRKAAGMGTLDT